MRHGGSSQASRQAAFAQQGAALSGYLARKSVRQQGVDFPAPECEASHNLNRLDLGTQKREENSSGAGLFWE
jgi:hypothetical protein